MDGKTTPLEAEERALRARIEELRQELDVFEARLHAIAHERESPRSRQVRVAVRLGASPAQPPVVSGPLIPSSVVPPHKPVSVLERLAQSARGTFFFAPRQDEADRSVALWVRSDSEQSARLGASPDVEFRAAVFTGHERGVALVVVLVRLGPEEPENLFEGWLDEASEATGGVLEALAEQESLDIRLHGDDCRLERVLRVPNPLRAFAAEARRALRALPPWSADASHDARAAVYQQHPTTRSLWRALK
jgi:hypothetical protein